MERSWLALQSTGSAGITGLWPAAALVCREGKWCRSGKNGATPPYENNKGRKKYPPPKKTSSKTAKTSVIHILVTETVTHSWQELSVSHFRLTFYAP